LLRIIESEPFDEIKTVLTAKALMVLHNPLLSAIKVGDNIVFIARVILIQRMDSYKGNVACRNKVGYAFLHLKIYI